MGRPEELARQFYEWERWGRGWELADYPVSIEPPFEPFFYHEVSRPPVDDGRKPTFLSSITEHIFGPPASAKPLTPPPTFELAPRVAFPLEEKTALFELHIILPPTLQTQRETFEQFMCAVSNCMRPIAFEIVGTEEAVIVQIAAEEIDCADVEAQLAAHFPEAAISRRDKNLQDDWDAAVSGYSALVDFGLSREFMIPLETRQNFANDPLIAVAGAQRVRHTFVIGASGTGKSTFLLNLIQQDVEKGEGLAVLDPHGDLIDEILGRIPENRWNDVVLFDPSDEMFPIGFNILSARSDLEKHLLASDLVAVFKRLSTSWGDQMTSVLGNAILAFLESTRGGTLADLRRFLIEPGFRSEILDTVQDKETVYYWKKEFPLLSGRPQASILTRLDTFLRPKIIRHMVSQKANRLDFAEIMNGKKIFLAKLSQGAIGEENAYLLGTLLVSKFHQMVMSRQATAAESRQNFWLYIDEFHNFVTPSLAAVLAGARKYRLGLILAHQELHQLQSRDTDVLNAVISNPYTRVCFGLGERHYLDLVDARVSSQAVWDVLVGNAQTFRRARSRWNGMPNPDFYG